MLLPDKATTVIEEQETHKLPFLPIQHEKRAEQPDPEDTRSEQASKDPSDQEEKLEYAYQEMLTAGERISGRALAKRAHVHRVKCNQWLRGRQENAEGVLHEISRVECGGML